VALFQIISAFLRHSSRVWKHYTRTLLVAEGAYIDSASVEYNVLSVSVRGVFAENAEGGISNAPTLALPSAPSLNAERFCTNAGPEVFLKADSAGGWQKLCALWFVPNSRNVFPKAHTRFWATDCISNSNALIG